MIHAIKHPCRFDRGEAINRPNSPDTTVQEMLTIAHQQIRRQNVFLVTLRESTAAQVPGPLGPRGRSLTA